MKAIFFHIFALVCLCGSATCGIFDDPKTVTKARCYANCITLVSQIPQNDSTCQSKECLQCKTPCDIPFSNLTSCNNTCKSRFCEKSCKFLDAMSKWPSIYVGNTTIPAPGAPIVKTKNVSSLELSWQPSNASKGSVVYMLKVKYQGDYTNGPTPMENIVYLDSLASLTAKQACTYKKRNIIQKQTYDGVTFKFSVVALTENSNLVESASGNAAFEKQDAVESVYNPLAYYERNDPGDDLRLQVTFKPSSALMGKNAKYLMITKAIPGPQIGLDQKTALLNTDKTANISLLIYQKITKMNISIQIYHMEECLPSKPKELIYLYKGCHYVSNYNKSLCCQFDPNEENSPPSTRKVSNLTYSPLQVTNDFQFNTTITWQPPTHSCPSVRGYTLQYGDKNDVIIFPGGVFWRGDRKDTTKTYFNVPASINPGIEYQFKIQPLFLDDFQKDVGIKTTLVFKTPDVPLKDTSIKKIQRSVSSFSSSDFFVVNITWSRPVFNYSSITSYNVTYNMEGDPSKSNLTTNQWFVVRGLDFRQSLNYQVIPIYKHSWIIANATSEQPVKIDPKETSLKITNLKHNDFTENKTLNLYSLKFTWNQPAFVKTVKHYKIHYTLKGYLGNELDCPSKRTVKRSCLLSTTTDTSYLLKNILPKERVEFTVTPVFNNTRFVAGTEAKAPVIRAPDPQDTLVKVQRLNFTEIGIFKYNITWEKPLFTHSGVSYYDVSYEMYSTSGSARKRRANIETKNITANYFITPGVEKGMQMTVKVTPQFKDKLIAGQTSELRLGGPPIDSHPTTGFSKGETAGLVIGVLFLVAFVLIIILLLLRSTRQKAIKEGRIVDRKKGAMIDQWEVFHDKLLLDDVIGQGAFGKVYKGTLVELPEQSSKYSSNMSFRRKSTRRSIKEEDGYTVAVKMLQDMADEEQRREFLKEIQLMKDVGSHRNIVNMLGCGTLSDPMFLIVEYLPNGDLLHYLRKRRGNVHQYPDSDPRGPYHSTYCQTYFNKDKPKLVAPIQQQNNTTDSDSPFYTYFNKIINRGFQDDDDGGLQLVSIQTGVTASHDDLPSDNNMTYDDDDEDDNITSGDLMAFAWQVSQGMEFLTRRGYVHRDLAARNVLVGENKEAKIADFGLTRHMYNSLYQAKANRRLPIKWMSIEAIFDQSFTEKSDVWAYGIFLWELVTLGGTPYPTKSIRELLKALKDGYRMEKPDTCDNEVYDIMLRCWEDKPEDRPTFTKIRNKLEEMMMRDNPYFDPSSVDETRDYYNVPSFNSIEDDPEGIEDEVFDGIFGEKKEKEDQEKLVNGGCHGDSDKDDKDSEPEKHDNESKEKPRDIGLGDIEALLYRRQYNTSSFST